MSHSAQCFRRFVFAGAIALATMALVWWAVPMSITYPSHARVGAGPADLLMENGRARFLHQAGYTVLAFDFRAHGESSGDRITFGYRESRDVAAALVYL